MFHHGTCQVEVDRRRQVSCRIGLFLTNDSSHLLLYIEHVIIFDVFPSIVNTAGGTLVRVSLLNRLPLILGMRYMCTELSCCT